LCHHHKGPDERGNEERARVIEVLLVGGGDLSGVVTGTFGKNQILKKQFCREPHSEKISTAGGKRKNMCVGVWKA